jgi:DegV family protein with EDD domain
MNKQKIAILVDSGVDIPTKLVKKYNMYVAPLKIVYSDREYSDGVDITAEELYNSLSTEVPKTSLPSGEEIQKIFDKMKSDGYEKVLAVTISSGLSGTYNAIRVLADQQQNLEVFVLDTKNIAIASGFNAIQAAEYIKEGMNWDTLIKTISKNLANSKVFFCVSTLEYLQKGGRIGLVSAILGSTLSLKPIISCNEDGIYYTVAKTIGRKRSLNKALALAIEFIGDHKNYNLGVVHGAAEKEANELKELLMSKLPNCKVFAEGQISPALGVHTGPGTIGIVAQKI